MEVSGNNAPDESTSAEGACAIENVDANHQTDEANESNDSIVYVGTFSCGKQILFKCIMSQY